MSTVQLRLRRTFFTIWLRIGDRLIFDVNRVFRAHAYMSQNDRNLSRYDRDKRWRVLVAYKQHQCISQFASPRCVAMLIKVK
jgi:hypothetical protein